VKVVKTKVYTSRHPRANEKAGLKFAGKEITYQVVDAKSKPFTTPAIIKENLTRTANTTDLPSPATWNSQDGTFVDAVGYATQVDGKRVVIPS